MSVGQDVGPQREGLPDEAKSFWERVFIDERLSRARKLLSIHEFHLILQHAQAAIAPGEKCGVDADYRELIDQVENKYPGETRHQAARRLIREAQYRNTGPVETALSQGGK